MNLASRPHIHLRIALNSARISREAQLFGHDDVAGGALALAHLPFPARPSMKPTHLSTVSEQARTAQLFLHVRDAVIMLDPSGIVTFWSLGAAQLYGKPASEALNRCYTELLHPHCRTNQVPHLLRAIEGEEHSSEWQTTGPDGKPLWLEGDFRPVFDGQRRCLGCSIILHDVTKWRAAEHARRTSDELLRSITDNIPGAVLQVRVCRDGERSVPFVSRGIETILEQSSKDLNAAFMADHGLVYPEDGHAFWTSLEHSRQNLTTWVIEFRSLTAKTRRLRWLRLRGVPSRLPDGATLWNGVLTDVSEQIEAANSLRESEARYRLLTDHATDLIARLTPDGEFLFVSPASKCLFGFVPEHYADRHFHEFLHEEDRSRVSDAFMRLRDGRAEDVFHHRLLTSTGSHIWCESTARVVRDECGKMLELVTVTRCIEERRKIEAKVQHSRKLEAVGRLAGGVAHDFNNLLTVINGFSEMVLRGLDTPDPVRIALQVQEIRKAGERAAGLTRQLLAFGRKQVQTRTRVNLNDVVEETRKLLGRVLGEDVEIETDLCPDLGSLNVDVGQVEQVLMNLVLNARDAMPDGGTLTIRTRNATVEAPAEEDVRPGQFVILSISDTGTGMDEETRTRAFEPFFTTKELGKGTGLGLATVHGIVKQSNGFIEVRSELDVGTSFDIYLPRHDSVADEPVTRSDPGILRGRETILLVEDDDSVRSVTASMLRTLGYRVVEANSGMDAVRCCRAHHGPIHLLLTDVVMPTMNGREVAERVQTLLPGVRTLFMSGYTDDSILRHGVLDQNVAFLCKPLSHETLGRKVREVLGGSASVG